MSLDHNRHGQYKPGADTEYWPLDYHEPGDVMSADEAAIRDRLWNHGIAYQPIEQPPLSIEREVVAQGLRCLLHDQPPIADWKRDMVNTFLDRLGRIESNNDVSVLLLADEPF